MAKPRIKITRQTSLQRRMGIDPIRDEERAERRRRFKEFVTPKKVYGTSRGRRIARRGRSKGKTSLTGVFRRVSHPRKSNGRNGTQSAMDLAFG